MTTQPTQAGSHMDRRACERVSDEALLFETGRRGLGWELLGVTAKMLKTPGSVRELLVVSIPRGATPEGVARLGAAMQGIDMAGQRVLMISDDCDLNVVDEDTMRSLGWVRDAES